MSRLTPPVNDRDHILGPPDAPVTLVEYGDFECPYCGMAYPIVESVRRRMGDSMCFVFRDFPLTQIHPHAQHAAEMAEAAGERGKFWQMHGILYQNQNALEDRDLIRYAARIGIPPEWAAAALRTHAFAPRVREHFMSGVRSGVNGTPTFFINGVRHDGGWDERSLLAAVQSAALVGSRR
ncbi:MAG TPA: thioredoxin domain-containing protein [Gemmatimonadales bacterium]|nr:thioredoxin domain-containing protein [Gemmatimonadales bacterium]